MPSRLHYLAAALAFSLLVIGSAALHSYHFAGANYRDDEIRTVHAGLIMSPVEVMRWMSMDIHPPLWRVAATSWVALFGPAETVTRFSSTLFAALALALIFRLGADVFDPQTGLFAALILGCHALFMFYGHELRPYSLLMVWVVGLHLAFLRWLKRPSFRYALLYVLCGAGALYTHFFALFVIAAQAAALVLVTHWNWRLYLRAGGLFALVGLAFFGWLPSFLHAFLVTKPGGIDYGIDAELVNARLIYTYLQMQPYSLGNLLIGVAVLIPVGKVLSPRESPHPNASLSGRGAVQKQETLFRFGQGSVKWYFAIVWVFIVVAAYATDNVIGVLTDRNLTTTIPALALLAAFGLRALPWQARWVAVGLIAYAGLTDFQRYERAEPFLQELAFIEAGYATGDPIVISVDNGVGAYFAHAYYLLDRLPGRVIQDDMLYFTLGVPRVNLPEALPNRVVDDSPPSLARFQTFIDGAQRVWWVTSSGEAGYVHVYRDLLERDFELVREETVDDLNRYKRIYMFQEYRRIG